MDNYTTSADTQRFPLLSSFARRTTMAIDADVKISEVRRFLTDLARALPHKQPAVAAAISELNSRTDDGLANFCECLSVHELDVLRAVLRLIMWWPFFEVEP
jgi:hypothetical protein